MILFEKTRLFDVRPTTTIKNFFIQFLISIDNKIKISLHLYLFHILLESDTLRQTTRGSVHSKYLNTAQQRVISS